MWPVVSPSKEAIHSESGPDNPSEDDLQGQGEEVRERLLQLCKALVQQEIILAHSLPYMKGSAEKQKHYRYTNTDRIGK